MARRSRNRGKSDMKKTDEKAPVARSGNSRSQLIRDAGNVAFTWPTGNPISFVPDVVWDHSADPTLYPVLGPSVKKWNLPGVISLGTIPTIGRAIDANDPATVASRSVYGYVRHANSGHANYDPPDLMMYLLGMDSIYTVYAWMCRIYGVLRNYSQINKYTPEVLVKAMGCDPDDLMSHIADFRTYINRFAAKASSLCVPNVFKYFQDHIDLYSRVFMDNRTIRGQFYLYNPEFVVKYNELDGKGRLDVVNLSYSANRSYNDIIGIADGILNAMIDSEDCGIISGDILKAYGDQSLIKLSMISEDYTVVPEYDELVLNTIANTIVACPQIGDATPWITQTDSGIVQCKPVILSSISPFQKANTMLAMPKFIRSMLESPEPGQVVDFTRHTVGTTHLYDNGYVIDVLGSELICHCTLFYYGWSVENESTLVMSYGLQASQFDNFMDVGVAQTREQVQVNAMLENFAWHPLLYYYRMRPNTGEELADTWLDIVGLGGDIDNYAVANNNTLKKIHDARIMEQLSVPLMGV